ncbi:hypothetical protein ElyMa_002217700 [Elysia marginata]|uniref:Uncharacterized protein n=1 Tax=Elysia marginata TaxID=1093978 RepID=A0AAV4FWG1_9GAST|nr:hypothetical protein ElyMa_002217700 [Elysia marginata]
MKALVESYNTADLLSSKTELDGSTSKNLDKSLPVRDRLKVVKLDSPVKFNDACVQPACVPNKGMDTNEIDFDDCRFVGYGNEKARMCM